MNVEIPDFSLVVLIGSTGSGKSTFAAKHFLPTEVISSDYCRGLVADDETDQSISVDAFDLVREIAGKRLKHRKLAVIDATNVRAAERLGRTGPQMARFASRYCIRPRHRHLHCAQ
jgi:protein phosphatase